MQQSFTGLYAHHYDRLFPFDTRELNFYRHFLPHNAPALEIACGTGTLLCAYAQEGFTVHGLDCSQAMLDQVVLKTTQTGIAIPLYHQALENLDVSIQFQTIYIPSCAFMFITDSQQAAHTLKRLHAHLLPGGRLVLSSFLPHQEMMSGAYKRHPIHDLALDEHRQLTVYQTIDYDCLAQLRTCTLDFELWHAGRLEMREQHVFQYRWYGIDELTMLIKNADFSDLIWYGDYQLKPLVHNAETLIVCAKKINSICQTDINFDIIKL